MVVGQVAATQLSFSALQCVAVGCSVLQCVAVCCSVLQCVAFCVDIGVGAGKARRPSPL